MTNRERHIRAWADGCYPDGKPHIPEGCESFTRDLLGVIDGVRAKLKRVEDDHDDELQNIAWDEEEAEYNRDRD